MLASTSGYGPGPVDMYKSILYLSLSSAVSPLPIRSHPSSDRGSQPSARWRVDRACFAWAPDDHHVYMQDTRSIRGRAVILGLSRNLFYCGFRFASVKARAIPAASDMFGLDTRSIRGRAVLFELYEPWTRLQLCLTSVWFYIWCFPSADYIPPNQGYRWTAIGSIAMGPRLYDHDSHSTRGRAIFGVATNLEVLHRLVSNDFCILCVIARYPIVIPTRLSEVLHRQRSTPHARLLVDMESGPAFPPELERELFETAALVHPATIPAVLRVAKRYMDWVGLSLTSTEWAIRHLATGEDTCSMKDAKQLLQLCTGIIDIMVDYDFTSPKFLPFIAEMRVERLAMDLEELFEFCSINLAHPLFHSVTHLDIFGFAAIAEVLLDVRLLPGLTHLALDRYIPRKNKPVPNGANSALDEDYWGNWLAGTRGLPDFWAQADAFVACKRNGEVEGRTS
ncbi:hypothetical protein B0H14DRAFT_3767446 [Mycena olivaceomarginata]|nr:hypothetical protein B0H14DRAFT_3767446 [Mycena olivaceomarginata]